MKKFYTVIGSINIGMLVPEDMQIFVAVFALGVFMTGIYFERDIFFGFKKEVKPDEQSDDGTDDVATK